MSHLDFKCYAGAGEQKRDLYHYSQSVKVGDQVFISGQGGWYPHASIQKYPSSLEDEIDQSFKNIELALNEAGAKLEQVFKVVSYHVNLTDETAEQMTVALKKYFPKHAPLWTLIGVAKLGEAGMRVEIEVIAHVIAAASKED